LFESSDKRTDSPENSRSSTPVVTARTRFRRSAQIAGTVCAFALTWAFRGPLPAVGAAAVFFAITWVLERRRALRGGVVTASIRLKAKLHEPHSPDAEPSHASRTRLCVVIGLVTTTCLAFTMHAVTRTPSGAWVAIAMMSSAAVFGYLGRQYFAASSTGRVHSYGLAVWFVSLGVSIVPSILGVGRQDPPLSDLEARRERIIHEEIDTMNLPTAAESQDTNISILAAVPLDKVLAAIKEFKTIAAHMWGICIAKRTRLREILNVRYEDDVFAPANSVWTSLNENYSTVASRPSVEREHYAGLCVSLKNALLQEDTCLRAAVWQDFTARKNEAGYSQ